MIAQITDVLEDCRMKMTSQVQNQCLVLSLQGRLDAVGAKELEQEIETRVTPELLCCALDMSGVDYLSSAGLRVLLMLYRKLKPRGGTLALSNIQPYCRGVLEVAGFSPIRLPIIETSWWLLQRAMVCNSRRAGVLSAGSSHPRSR